MMNNSPATTVLLTNCFPYGEQHETFLETEIEHHTSPTVIFALYGRKGGSRYPHLPQCCSSYIIEERQITLLRKITGRLWSLTKRDVYIELRSLLTRKNLSLYTFKKLLYATWHGRYAYKKIKRALLCEGYKKDSRFIFYAYWMRIPAYTAILLKRYFQNSVAVTRCHRYDLYQERNERGHIPLRHLISSNIDRFYPISSDGLNYLTEKHSIEKSRITLSRLGTKDCGIVSPGGRGELRIVSCSALIEVKRVHLIIEALACIANIPVVWTHFGSGELEMQLKSKAGQLLGVLPDLRHRWKGHVSNADVLAHYKESPYHLFVNVSASEGVPVSIMEALSFGTPVIATEVGGTPEIIKHKVNGWLLPADFAVSELADAIQHFFEIDDDEYTGYRQRARETWEIMCNANKIYPEFLNSLQDEGSKI